jgi:cysteinyl-tRNA synthetase
MLKVYNTLKRKKEEFKPLSKDKEVGMYTCGPTVYWFQHIGNMRAYIFADTLKRVLQYNGYKVKHIINVTDVGHLTSDRDEGEDKVEQEAKKEGKTAKEITEFYFNIFRVDLKKLNILFPDLWPRATEHIKEQIDLIKKLQARGYTYITNDGIYFDTSKFKNYGKLARLKTEELKAGARVEMRDKKHPTDFALWKFSEKPGKRQQEWNPEDFGADWPVGFPGWHIECSAMSMKYLGEHFDIHTGGEDHIPVHHTNEIAQSECATGKKFVNYWLHTAFLTFKGEKVSKSTGGLFTISELEGLGYNPLAYRYFVLLTHYRKHLDFSLANLDAAKRTFERITKKIVELKENPVRGEDRTKRYQKEFENAINDDLNTPLAIQVFLKALDDLDFGSKKKLALFYKFDEILGLGIKEMKKKIITIPTDVRKLIEARERLRKEKKWAEADVLRERIKEKGYLIKDTPQGPELEKAE